MEKQLPEEMQRYLDELAADITANVAPEDIAKTDMLTLAKDAHERRQQFAVEMADGNTKRSQMAHRAMATSIWIGAQQEKAVNGFLFDCEHIASKP